MSDLRHLLVADDVPDRGLEQLVRSALASSRQVVVVTGDALARACWSTLAERYFPAGRVRVGDTPEGTPLDSTRPDYCRGCDAYVFEDACPHPASLRYRLDLLSVEQIVRGGGNLPRELYRPEVTEVLRAHLLSTKGALAAADAKLDHRPEVKAGGFIVWFTGLSGAGKSTLSKALAQELAGRVRFEVLDGDEVRTYLSKGLGFSKEDRDTNVRRIGYVARLLARNGTPVVTAAISPYRDVRDEIRALAEKDGLPFVEVFASASVEALAGRDVKGLYRKALAGELAHFTGVSDPYEPPSSPDVVAHTDQEPISTSLERIVRHLEDRGLVPASRRVA